MIPYDSDYSTAVSGTGLTVSDCSNIPFNGINGCNNVTDFNNGCADNSILSVHCERGDKHYCVILIIIIFMIVFLCRVSIIWSNPSSTNYYNQF